jgi:hypothetical protein
MSSTRSPAALSTTTHNLHGTVLVDGAEVFPLGLSLPPPLGGLTPAGGDALDEVAGAGIALLRFGPHRGEWSDAALTDAGSWNAAAAARGIHTWIALGDLAHAAPGTPEDARLQEVVTTLKDSPGFGLWKGQEEPFLTGFSAASLRHAHEATHALDPDHLLAIIEAPRGTAADLAPYSAVCDGHGVDVYPVPFGSPDPDLHRVGRWTRRLRTITPTRVVFTTLQICFSGSDDPAGSGAFVLPTHRQARYMAYDAILNGARGLLFYGGHLARCADPADAALGWNWTFWNNVLKHLVGEIGPHGMLYPALLAPDSGPRLRTTDPTTEIMSRRVGTRLWVIAARSGPGTRDVTITGLPDTVTKGAHYRSKRPVTVRAGTFTETFSQWDVHVYHFRARAG